MKQRQVLTQALLASFILIVCAATMVTTGWAGPREDVAIHDVQKVFDNYIVGWKTGNVTLLSNIYANDAKVSAFWPDPSRPKLLVGWTKISSNLQDIFERIKGMDLDFNERQVDIYGNTAVLTSSWVWHSPADPAFGTGRATFVFEHRGAKWVIVHEHSSVTPFDSGK